MPEGIIIIPHRALIDAVTSAGRTDFFPAFLNTGMIVLILCDLKERDAFVLGDAIVKIGVNPPPARTFPATLSQETCHLVGAACH